jgi:hypothetical protein
MANRSDRTRTEQVLDTLRAALDGDGWVDGPDLANERVGGSEGLKRLREQRADGFVIDKRRHPDKTRSIWQYRLTSEPGQPRAVQTALHGVVADPGPPSAPPEADTRTAGERAADAFEPFLAFESPAEIEYVACPQCNGPLGDVKPSLDPRYLTGRCGRHGTVMVRRR